MCNQFPSPVWRNKTKRDQKPCSDNLAYPAEYLTREIILLQSELFHRVNPSRRWLWAMIGAGSLAMRGRQHGTDPRWPGPVRVRIAEYTRIRNVVLNRFQFLALTGIPAEDFFAKEHHLVGVRLLPVPNSHAVTEAQTCTRHLPTSVVLLINYIFNADSWGIRKRRWNNMFILHYCEEIHIKVRLTYWLHSLQYWSPFVLPQWIP